MNGMDIARIIMWIITIGVIPPLVYLFMRVRDLELKMETRISQREAAAMLKASTDSLNKRFDKIESLILDDLRGR